MLLCVWFFVAFQKGRLSVWLRFRKAGFPFGCVIGRAGLCLGLPLRAGLVRGFLVTIEAMLGCSRLERRGLAARAAVASG